MTSPIPVATPTTPPTLPTGLNPDASVVRVIPNICQAGYRCTWVQRTHQQQPAWYLLVESPAGEPAWRAYLRACIYHRPDGILELPGGQVSGYLDSVEGLQVVSLMVAVQRLMPSLTWCKSRLALLSDKKVGTPVLAYDGWRHLEIIARPPAIVALHKAEVLHTFKTQPMPQASEVADQMRLLSAQRIPGRQWEDFVEVWNRTHPTLPKLTLGNGYIYSQDPHIPIHLRLDGKQAVLETGGGVKPPHFVRLALVLKTLAPLLK